MAQLYINGRPFGLDFIDPRYEMCDQCERPKSIAGGRTIYASGYQYDEIGEAIAWICAECLQN
jgi:hypothetical protein